MSKTKIQIGNQRIGKWDIDSYFDTVNRRFVIEALQGDINDRSGLAEAITAFLLESKFITEAEAQRGGNWGRVRTTRKLRP